MSEPKAPTGLKGDDRPLPHNLDAEQALLGALMLNNLAYQKIADIVAPEDFYEPVHVEIFDIIRHLITRDRVANPVTMKNLVSEITVGHRSGREYLSLLCTEATTVINAPDYAREVNDMAVRRRVIAACDAMVKRAMGQSREDTGVKLVDELETELSEIRPRTDSASNDFESFAASSSRALEIAERAFKKGGVMAGVSTGLHDLDDMTGGLTQSDLIIIGGRPGMGKTSLVTNIALRVALEIAETRRVTSINEGVVGFFSLEMSSDQLATRVLSEYARVSGFNLRKGRVSADEFEGFANAQHTLRDLPLRTDSTGAISITNLVIRARNLKKRFGLKLLIVDYLQLVKGSPGRRDRNRVEEVTEITTGLKALAKELNVPIIALSQLSRKLEDRDDKRPMMSDLRESGSIEQDADIILLVYRDEVYLKKEEPRNGSPEDMIRWQDAMERAKAVAEVIIAKNRHGPEGTVKLGWDAKITQFNNDVPQPPERAKADEPKDRKAGKPPKMRLPAEATKGFGILKRLSISDSFDNDGMIAKAPKEARIVKYADWRASCAEDLLEQGHTEKVATALMQRIIRALQAPGEGYAPLIGRAIDKEISYVWLEKKQ